MRVEKVLMSVLLSLSLIQGVMVRAEETEDTQVEVDRLPSIYDIEIESNVAAGEVFATDSQAATITNKQAKKGVEVTDTIKYSGLMPDEKYEITLELVYYEGYEEKVVAKSIVNKKSSDTGEGTWKLSLDTVKGLEPGIKYHINEEIVSEKAFEFLEGIQKQEYLQNDPYLTNTMIKVAEKNEIPSASKEVLFYGRNKYEAPTYTVVKMSSTGTQGETLDVWEGNVEHPLILSEGQYAYLEFKDEERLEASGAVYFHMAQDGTIELRKEEGGWTKLDDNKVYIDGKAPVKKKAKKKKETPETALYTNMVELLVILMIALIAAVKVLCSRLFTVD